MRHLIISVVLAYILCGAELCVNAQELSPAIRGVLTERCSGCHDAAEKSGGLDLVGLMAEFSADVDLNSWTKVESAVTKHKMPPPDDEPLAQSQIDIVANWFESQFVTPGGVQHAGPSHPKRLTREELQNTLEDVLHLDIRSPVTNSRLHVIPDTIIEKFFAAGVVGDSGFSNDAIMLNKESIDIQTYSRCFSLVLAGLDSNAAARKRLFETETLPLELSADQARQAIRKFGRSAFRREMSDQELNSVSAVYEQAAKTRSSLQAMKSSFLAVLLSPPFLYRFEEPTTEQSLVTDNELAVRLSYFLWSSPPDQELLTLAAQRKLQDPAMLKQQLRRMLADSRRIALAENLGGEWFDYKKLRQQSSVDKRSDQLAGFYRTQYEEALLLFDSIIRYDQTVFSTVDADWVFMNRHQANIYKLKMEPMKLDSANELPPISIHFRSHDRKVQEGNYEYKHTPLAIAKLGDPDRVGFLTAGATLSVTSTENRTSPIRRGVWVMERILGEHFVVPEDVPDLESTQAKARQQKLNLSHNEILKLHSSQQGCAACHKFIDPIGFGLERFDQRGIARNVTESAPSGEKLSWNPMLTHRKYADQTWDITKPLILNAETRVIFQYTKGGARLNIKNVRLRSGNVEVMDAHFGFAGGAHRDNTWRFMIPEDAPTANWRLIAEIEGDGSTDSHGVITIAGPQDKASGQLLPNGKSFSSPAELKDILISDYSEPMIDNIVRRVLAYALGRKLLPVDRPAIREIKKSLAANDYRMNALLEAVILSYPFRHKEFE